MRAITKEVIDEIQTKCPKFAEMCIDVKRGVVDQCIMTLDAFAGEPDLFYKAMWYANHFGVTILLAPKSKTQERKK